MELLPTWRVWRLIHRYQKPKKFEAMMRILRVPPSGVWLSLLNNLWWWVGAAFVLNCGALIIITFAPNVSYEVMFIIGWLPSIGITLFCLEFGLRLLNSIVRRQAAGDLDLLLILPTSRLGIVVDIVRAHRYPFDGRVRGGSAIFLVLYLFTACFSVMSTGLRSFLSPIQVLSVETMPLWGIVSFLEYVQSFVATVLIVLLVSHQQTSGTRQMAIIGWFIGLQIGFALFNYFVAVGAGLNIVSVKGSELSIRDVFVWSVFVQPALAVFCRELVNFVLWRLVKRRLEA